MFGAFEILSPALENPRVQSTWALNGGLCARGGFGFLFGSAFQGDDGWWWWGVLIRATVEPPYSRHPLSAIRLPFRTDVGHFGICWASHSEIGIPSRNRAAWGEFHLPEWHLLPFIPQKELRPYLIKKYYKTSKKNGRDEEGTKTNRGRHFEAGNLATRNSELGTPNQRQNQNQNPSQNPWVPHFGPHRTTSGTCAILCILINDQPQEWVVPVVGWPTGSPALLTRRLTDFGVTRPIQDYCRTSSSGTSGIHWKNMHKLCLDLPVNKIRFLVLC